MAPKFPEVNVAPGEGQSPKSMMTDQDWDIKAFPHLHNFDGTNGKDQERKVKLTAQRYFIQRICNKEARFSKCPAYLYAAVAYLEERQINRNISLVGLRGRRLQTEDGKVSYELDDEYRAIESIPNTPKYWKKAKYEVLAKLDNFGPFQVFFTLSCADLRWEANFAAILLEKGYSINIKVAPKDGVPTPEIEARSAGGAWKPIKQFIAEDVEESNHELIRGNVLTATRYFHQRVKLFINKIVMAKSNPLCAKYYSYKVEFQQRGAAHVHGIIWLNLFRLEKLILKDGELAHPPDDYVIRDQESSYTPLKGIAKVFLKLRNCERLSKEDISILTVFIDSFTTVSTHGPTVGDDVVAIVKEVNTHNHSYTCLKRGTDCRFKYPRPPAPYTIVAEPLENLELAEERKILKKHKDVITAVLDALEDSTIVEDLMEKFDKASEKAGSEHREGRVKRIQELCKHAKVSYQDYIKALSTSRLGYTVVLQRDVDEIYVNSYNAEWIRAWDGNIDFQIALDFFSIITYITDYYSKDDSGTSELIKQGMAECTSKEVIVR